MNPMSPDPPPRSGLLFWAAVSACFPQPRLPAAPVASTLKSGNPHARTADRPTGAPDCRLSLAPPPAGRRQRRRVRTGGHHAGVGLRGPHRRVHHGPRRGADCLLRPAGAHVAAARLTHPPQPTPTVLLRNKQTVQHPSNPTLPPPPPKIRNSPPVRASSARFSENPHEHPPAGDTAARITGGRRGDG